MTCGYIFCSRKFSILFKKKRSLRTWDELLFDILKTFFCVCVCVDFVHCTLNRVNHYIVIHRILKSLEPTIVFRRSSTLYSILIFHILLDLFTCFWYSHTDSIRFLELFQSSVFHSKEMIKLTSRRQHPLTTSTSHPIQSGLSKWHHRWSVYTDTFKFIIN